MASSIEEILQEPKELRTYGEVWGWWAIINLFEKAHSMLKIWWVPSVLVLWVINENSKKPHAKNQLNGNVAI
jgi:hypothetical protein